VQRFLDTPVKRYSSGMYVRLAFAVAAGAGEHDANGVFALVLGKGPRKTSRSGYARGVGDGATTQSPLLDGSTVSADAT
jgi:hypothetical protein